MFDLETAIANWRQQMLAAGIQTPVPLEELEIHLREDIDQLVKSGQDEQTAFAAAVQKIGSGQMLRNEFSNVERGRGNRRQYLFFEIIFMAGTVSIPLMTGAQAFLFKDGRFSEMTFGQQTAILAAAGAFAALAGGVRIGFGNFLWLRTNRVRDAIFVTVLLVVIAGMIILPRCDFPDAQRGVISLWAFTPFGILIGWCWGFAAAAKKSSDSGFVKGKKPYV